MNKILKQVLMTAKDIALDTATHAVPGAGVVISGVTKMFDKDKTNNTDGLMEIESGVIASINAIKQTDMIDPAMVAEGIKELQSGFDKIRKGIGK
jgi:6,7-dimethyl-8-ribityllumazine synthase